MITVEDQEYCEQNEYPFPKRCKPCRLVKKARFEVKEKAMTAEQIREESPFKAIYDQVCRPKSKV